MRVLTTAAALPDRELLARLTALAGNERKATVELVAHLAVLDARPAVYAAEGYGSLFRYCTDALRLSEDAACNRIEAARACRRFPVILDRLASGSLSVTTVRLLGRHLTSENHEQVLARAEGRSRHEIDRLIAELAPRPDVPTLVRKLPTPIIPGPAAPTSGVSPVAAYALRQPLSEAPPIPASSPRPIVQPTAPERYRVQCTIGGEAHEKLRRLQALLRREIPDGDAGAIVERALGVLLAEVEKKKLGAVDDPAAIRPRTDRPKSTRHIPRSVRRAVWRRDGGQCAFVSRTGRRCQERTFLEFHHRQPYAMRGPTTVPNVALHCRRHNQYEAEQVFGQRDTVPG